MPLNSSGSISMGGSVVGQSINLELGRSATAQSSLNDSSLRALAGISTGQISLSHFYGKTLGSSSSIITVTVGSGGAPGFGAQNGGTGGTTTIAFPARNISLTANGGGGGVYQSTSTFALGGTASGGTTNFTGGYGKSSSGDNGGGGGGAIGGVNATHEGNTAGDNGAQSANVQSLFELLNANGIATTGPGAGSPPGSGGQNNKGGNATGFGCGGGGGGWWGGGGGDGLSGGGGGGASGYGSTWTGGTGGAGAVIIRFMNSAYGDLQTVIQRTAGNYSYSPPSGTAIIRFYAIGGGGGGSGATTNDGDSGGGGGAGGISYVEVAL